MPGFEESAEDLYENAPCGYLSTRPDGTIARVNATFLRWTGHSRDELVGIRRFQDLLTVGGRIYHETHYAPLLRMQGHVREIAVEVVGADGRRLPVLVNSVLLRDDDGEPSVIRTTVFDATERQSYEHELLAARDREHLARERVERLQRVTAVLAAAPDAETIEEAVIGELAAALGAEQGDVDPAALGGKAEFDEGEGDRGAEVRLPLAGPAGPLGRLTLRFAEPRGFEPDDREFLLACVRQTALALERSRLYEQTRDVASSLQRSLLADPPPRDPRFEVATRYLPAVEHLEVGGDWHDVFALADGRVGIVVGDVVGRGLGAASAMGQLRSAVRALAGAGCHPAEILTHLDTFVAQVEAARFATLAYAVVDPATGETTCASAGHMPPVLIRPGEPPRLFMEGRSPPLGMPPGVVRREAAFTLAPGDGVLLFTDGLVERRGEVIDDGLDRLLAEISALPDAAPAELARRLPEALEARGDDVCLLAFRLSGSR